MMFVDPSSSVQLVRDGKLRALGVTTAQRAPMAIEIPPLAEAGLPGFNAASWHMIVAPSATPKPILHRLNTELTAIIMEPKAAEELTRRGFIPVAGGSPEQLAAFVKSEIDRWGKVVRQAGAAGIE
jgi:tripartite-type tricarboxylate transporter receptor subunit TctC